MSGMSMKEIARLLDHVEPQGVRPTRTKNGILLRLPDGKTAMVHFTTSDVNARKALRATLKRSGITMPTDRHQTTQLASYITDVNPTRATRERAQVALDRMGMAKVTSQQLVNAGGAKNVVQAAQVLYALGWLPERPGKGQRKRWVRPVEQDPEPIVLHAEPEVVPETAPAPEPEPVPEPIPEPVVEPAPEPERVPEVVAATQVVTPPPPTSQAWSLRWEDLPGEWTVEQLRLMLMAFHLEADLVVRHDVDA